MGTPVFWGSEFVVNAGTTAGNQATAQIAVLQDGTFVMVWADGSQTGTDKDNFAIRAQIFNADGSKKGGIIDVNQVNTAGTQGFPSVAVLKDGNFVIAWEDDAAEGSYGIWAKVYRPDGMAASEELHVNTTQQGTQWDPSVSALSDGGFIVGYHSIGPTGMQILAQAYSPLYQKAGAEVVVSASSTGARSEPVMMGLPSGGYIGFSADRSGTLGDDAGIHGRILTAAGAPVGTEFRVNSSTLGVQDSPSVTMLANGRMVVVWTSDDNGNGDGEGRSIKAQILNADGSRFRGEFLVNTTTRGDQYAPSVTALPDGGFTIAFVDHNILSNDYDVRLVAFNSAGILLFDDVVGHSSSAGRQFEPSLATLKDGRLILSWTSQADGLSDLDVHAQIIDLRGYGTVLAGSGGGEQLAGTVGADRIDAGGGNDTVFGADGDDILNGGPSADRLDGGAGHDTVSYAGSGPVSVNLVTGANSDGDTLISIEGVIGSAGGDTLAGSWGHILQGAGGDDIYMVSGNALVVEAAGQGYDTVIASGSYSLSRSAEVEVLRFDDPAGTAGFSLEGSDTANRISGNSGANLINGWGGDDVLRGGLGNDTLKGDAGKDVFVFDTKPNKKSNMDKIVDFSVKDDSIWLDNAVFTKLGKAGSADKPVQLKKDFFTIGSKAKDKNDYLIYDDKKGVLYYDADGSGKGKAVEIATLSKKLHMTYKDFFIV